MLPILPAMALNASEPRLIYPTRPHIIRPTDAERAQFDPALAGIGPIAAGRRRSGGGDPYFSNVKLLVGFNGTNGSTSFTDESASPHTLTAVGNAQVSTANFKFGTGSGLFDGSGDYITTPDSADWLLGDNGFTIELFARFLTKTSSQALVSQWDNGGSFSNIGFGFWLSNTGKLTFLLPYANVGGGTNTISTDVSFSFTPTLSTRWYHIAVDMAAPTGAGPGKTIQPVRLYVDGVMGAKSTPSDPTYGFRNSTQPLSIGRLGTSGTSYSAYDFNGNIDELRITSGVARYNSDSGFTVPASAYPRS